MLDDDIENQALIDVYTQAVSDKDGVRAFAALIASFDVAPLISLDPDVLHDVSEMNRWLATFRGPIHSDDVDLAVGVCGDVGHASCRCNVTGTRIDGEFVSTWFRTTASFRRSRSGWRVVHLHNSVPLESLGSERAFSYAHH